MIYILYILLIGLNFSLYLRGGNPFSLWTCGFIRGLMAAVAIRDLL